MREYFGFLRIILTIMIIILCLIIVMCVSSFLYISCFVSSYRSCFCIWFPRVLRLPIRSYLCFSTSSSLFGSSCVSYSFPLRCVLLVFLLPMFIVRLLFMCLSAFCVVFVLSVFLFFLFVVFWFVLSF